MRMRALLIAGLALALASCATAPNPGADDAAAPEAQPLGEKLSATVLHNTLQCGNDLRDPNASWISDPQQLNQRYRQISRAAPETQTPPLIDFTREGVLLISMGQRPSGGYLLNYQEQPIHFNGKVLDAEVLWQEPLPGYQQAQVITTPCLLLKLPALEGIEQIRIRDQEGEVRLDIGV